MARKKLNRGLDQLLGTPQSVGGRGGDLPQLRIDRIVPNPSQPRRHFEPESISKLAASIAEQGVMQPVVVRPGEDERYELIAGERRWRAAQQANLERIPAIVRHTSDDEALLLALIENLQREDLNAYEQARAFQQLKSDHQLTDERIGAATGKSRVTVTNLLRLLKLHPAVLKQLAAGELEQGQARPLLRLAPHSQPAVANKIIRDGLSARASESLVSRTLQGAAPKPPTERDRDLVVLENELADLLKTQVTIKHATKRGRGVVTIRYASLDQLDGILSQLRKT